MIWSGHHHSYQRSCPVYKKECVGYDENGAAKAMVHVVFGNAGATIYTNLVPVDFIEVINFDYFSSVDVEFCRRLVWNLDIFVLMQMLLILRLRV